MFCDGGSEYWELGGGGIGGGGRGGFSDVEGDRGGWGVAGGGG